MNESIVDNLIKKALPVLEVPRVTQSVELSEDEEKILRYACGYVSMKLRPRYSKFSDDKAAQFVECLDRTRHDNDEGPTISFLDYTRELVHKINRGELLWCVIIPTNSLFL